MNLSQYLERQTNPRYQSYTISVRNKHVIVMFQGQKLVDLTEQCEAVGCRRLAVCEVAGFSYCKQHGIKSARIREERVNWSWRARFTEY